MLTQKQHDLLLLIHNRLAKNGVAPSFDEMKDAVGLKSKSGIHRLITALEERGFLRRLPQRARALEVLRLPGDMSRDMARDTDRGMDKAPISSAAGEERQPIQGINAAPPTSFSEFKARKTGNSLRRHGFVPLKDSAQDSVSLPLYGRIAAGLPIEAIEDPSTRLDVPANMLGSGDYYALEVSGDSMIEEGIMDGDMVVIQSTNQAHNGEIVVAMIDDYDVTLKRFRKHGDSIALEPANRNYETRVFKASQVTVRGRLVGLLRHY